MNSLEERLREALRERATQSPVSQDAWARTLARTRRRTWAPAWTRFAARSTRQTGTRCDMRPLICDAITIPIATAPNSQPNCSVGSLYRLMNTNGALVIYAKVPAEPNPHTAEAPRNVRSLNRRV